MQNTSKLEDRELALKYIAPVESRFLTTQSPSAIASPVRPSVHPRYWHRKRLAAEALMKSSNAASVIGMDEVKTSDATVDRTEHEDRPQLENNAPEHPVAQTISADRIFTVMRGNRVDITGLGVDPEFLDALSEDSREEFLYRYIRDRRAAAPPYATLTHTSSFLKALPPDIRAELLEAEAAESRRRERVDQRVTKSQSGFEYTHVINH